MCLENHHPSFRAAFGTVLAVALWLGGVFAPSAQAGERFYAACGEGEIRILPVEVRDVSGVHAWRWQDGRHGVDFVVLESGNPALDGPFRTTLSGALCLLRSVPDIYQRVLARKEKEPTTRHPRHQARLIRMLKLDKGVNDPGVPKGGMTPGKLRRGAVLADYTEGVLTFFPAIFKRPFYSSALFWSSNLVHEWTHKEQARQGLLVPDALSFLELHADLHQQLYLESLPAEIIRQQGREYSLQLENARERNADTLRMMGTRWFRDGLSTLERICMLEIYLLEEQFKSGGYGRGEYCRGAAVANLARPAESFIPPPKEGVVVAPLAQDFGSGDDASILEGLKLDGRWLE